MNIESIRKDFPMLQQQMNGKPLIYFDNGATALKPQCVIDSITRYYTDISSNIHRGVYALSAQATDLYEASRNEVASLLGAEDSRSIVFTKNSTEAINLVAQSYGSLVLREGDEVIISEMEHHANIVPWKMLCDRVGATLRVIPVSDEGQPDVDVFESLLSERTALVALIHVSNSLGSVVDVAPFIEKAHAVGSKVLIDGSQAVPHMQVNVTTLDADFYVFTGHKLFGPTGVGVLYAKPELLEAMPPYQGGGDMIRSVSFDHIAYAPIPHKFEAGTPAIASVIALKESITYIKQLEGSLEASYKNISEREYELAQYLYAQIRSLSFVRIIADKADPRVPICSFVLDEVHAHDVGSILDEHGIAIRAGHHCTQPVMKRFGVPATARASLSFYNTKEEIDALVCALRDVNELLA